MTPHRRQSAVCLFLTLLPPLVALAVILGYGVNAPFFDDFLSPGEMLVKEAHGALRASDWIAQHNEHRILFPRLIYMALAAPAGWNPRLQMLASWMIAWAFLFAVWKLGSRGVALFVSSLLIFSMVQHQNWTWGLQIMMFLPIACVALALAALQSERSPATRLFITASLAVIATFSAGSGMLAWIVLIPSLLAADWIPTTRRRTAVALWLGAFALCAGVYFTGYQKPPTASLTHALEHPIEAAYWFLAFLGSPLAWVNGPGAATAAATTLAAVTWMCWRSRRDSLPWATLAAFTVAIAASATLARSGDGIGQALSARYSTLVLPLCVAAVNLAGVALPASRAHWIVSAVLILHLISCVRAFSWMEDFWRERRHGRACMVWSSQVEAKDCLASVFPGRGPLISPLVDELAGLGHLPFARATRNYEFVPTADKAKGWFDHLDKLPDGSWRATGWAARHDRYRGPDAVLIAYTRIEGGESGPVVVGVSTAPLEHRGDVLEFAAHPRIGWQTHIAASSLPKGKLAVTAWAFTIRQPSGAWEILPVPGVFHVDIP